MVARPEEPGLARRDDEELDAATRRVALVKNLALIEEVLASGFAVEPPPAQGPERLEVAKAGLLEEPKRPCKPPRGRLVLDLQHGELAFGVGRVEPASVGAAVVDRHVVSHRFPL